MSQFNLETDILTLQQHRHSLSPCPELFTFGLPTENHNNSDMDPLPSIEVAPDLDSNPWWPFSGKLEALMTIMTAFLNSKTSYRNLAARAKNFVATYPLQFLMPAYSSDPLVRKAVNAELDRLAHQIRGSFRKLIFAGAVGGRPLVQLTKGIVEMYSNQPSLGTPIQVQAHIAQLRLIATEIIAAIPAPNTESDAPGSNPRKRLRNDTGFWATVDAKFIQLVDTHGEDYNSPGWRIWETQIIGVDSDRFSDPANQLPPEAINHWANTGADPED
ncbi:hypothetical protein RSAG8_05153, partial [Rhizoctonia solani AG-8 WAC10335]